MDIDLIINSKFFGSQQTHRKKDLHQIYLQEHQGEYCVGDQRERRSHLATAYGPIGIWWTTHACMNLTVMVLDWITWFWNLRRLELCFFDSPRVSGIFGNL